MKDECTLCNRVLSLYSLRSCAKCKKLYCRSCMTVNLWSEQRDYICLNCARRIVAPRRAGSKYSPLREYLWRRGQYTSLVRLTFSRIEGIINDNLPLGALRSESWWKGRTTSQGRAWTSAGWEVQSISLMERAVTFKKQTKEEATNKPSKKRRRKPALKPFTPVPVRSRKIREPSKTRIAKVVARARNLERRKEMKSLRIKLKPRTAYEKRLYKPEAKPESNS